MANSSQTGPRQGFTLVEVALAVAVGLIIIGGAVLGYDAVKGAAGNTAARERVMMAQTFLEEYGSVNLGHYPASATGGNVFSALWRTKRPDDYNKSPYGGSTFNAGGVLERAAVTGGASAASAVRLSTGSAAFAENVAVPFQSGLLLYVSVNGGGWGSATHPDVGSAVPVKGYAISIFDRQGFPYFNLRGGS